MDRLALIKNRLPGAIGNSAPKPGFDLLRERPKPTT